MNEKAVLVGNWESVSARLKMVNAAVPLPVRCWTSVEAGRREWDQLEPKSSKVANKPRSRGIEKIVVEREIDSSAGKSGGAINVKMDFLGEEDDGPSVSGCPFSFDGIEGVEVTKKDAVEARMGLMA
ncbi:hypothetical protein CLAIMM_09825 isoform 2 [Cladophialophora immunda]|nr:hypothetical protein CLAIMM_09825 isoform 1 [Cladophialophora immunda]OQV05025.1 hypothetical protein CLAIMM_09825 isoform 2 [Cladophialophora immunda]